MREGSSLPNDAVGVFYDVPAEDYFAADAVNNSLLSSMAVSPFHCWAMHINPERPKRLPTRSMVNGTLVHAASLEPNAIDGRYIFTPEDAPRRPSERQRQAKKPSQETLDAIAWWDDFNCRAEGREIVSYDDLQTAKAQVKALLSVEEIAYLMSDCRTEVTALWVDPQTGLRCKMRADIVRTIGDGRAIIGDVKTTSDAMPKEFAKSIARFGYHRQASWYTKGWTLAAKQDVAAFVFGAVASSYPFLALPHVLDDEALAVGHSETRRLLDLYAECKATDRWPAVPSTPCIISLPRWAT